jgi:hypothetical protein
VFLKYNVSQVEEKDLRHCLKSDYQHRHSDNIIERIHELLRDLFLIFAIQMHCVHLVHANLLVHNVKHAFVLNKCVIVDIVFNFVGMDGNNAMIG